MILFCDFTKRNVMSLNPACSPDYSSILSFMKEQSSVIECQKKIIDNQQQIIQAQRHQIDSQDIRIRQLAMDVEMIKRTSVEVAKESIDKEVAAHRLRTEKDMKDVTKKVRELQESNESMKALAAVGGMIAVGCVVYTCWPVAAVVTIL